MGKSVHNLLVRRIHDKQLLAFAKTYLSGKMLDIGCGPKPYENLLSPFVEQHLGLDHENTLHSQAKIDLLGTAYDIPVGDSEFDSAICTAVLEHLEEPAQALGECYRVLKPGGYAIYSIPLIWHVHEQPRDFYRFTNFGINYLFQKVGFEMIEVKALSGFWVTFGQLFVYQLNRFNRGPLKWLRIVDGLGLVIQGVSYLMDKLDKTEIWTWMYMVVVRKPIQNPVSKA